MGFEVVQDKGGQWRWRYVARNGEQTASSGQSFASKSNAVRAANAFRESVKDGGDEEPTVVESASETS